MNGLCFQISLNQWDDFMFEETDNKELFELLLMILIMGVWYLIRRNSGDYIINHGLFEILLFWTLYASGEYILWRSRYFMSFVVCTGHSGSVGERPDVVGDYAIFACGEVYDPVHVRGKISTLVLPKKSIVRAGRNYISRVFVKKYPILSLPPEVHRYLYRRSNDFNIYNIYFGRWSEEFILEHKEDIPEFEEEVSNLCQAINKRDRIVEGDDDLMIEKIEAYKKLAESKPAFPFFGGRKKEEE